MAVLLPENELKHKLLEISSILEEYLTGCQADDRIPSRLREAMRYSLCAGGKRLRPVLLLECAKLCGASFEEVMPFAVAVEMIHTYSLIHDDLPAMDNDDLRRGKASSHKAFDEATAILAGDALLADAFCMMCKSKVPERRIVAAIERISLAAGSAGMAGGQMLDMLYTGKKEIEMTELASMQEMKTGALIQGSCLCGAILAGASRNMLEKIGAYGFALGKSFQIADDILDIVSDTATIGKPAGSDKAKAKITYPSLFGLANSRVLAKKYHARAIHALSGLEGSDADFLRALSVYAINRID